MENDPVLRNDHSWYDMTREEMQDCLLKKTRRAYEIERDQFFHNFETGTYQWFYMIMKGIVSI